MRRFLFAFAVVVMRSSSATKKRPAAWLVYDFEPWDNAEPPACDESVPPRGFRVSPRGNDAFDEGKLWKDRTGT
jgi:hypothetical protein